MRGVLLLVCTIGFGLAGALPAASAPECVDADPSGTTARVHGDFEFTVDPDDPAKNLVFVANLDSGPSRIVIAHVDGATGKVVPKSLRAIAENFNGDQHVNGPEFVHPRGLGLGVLYHAAGGVHGVFRPVSPPSWSSFHLSIAGAETKQRPPALPSTIPGAYDGGGLPFDQDTYTLNSGACLGRCFASIRHGVPTDPTRIFQKYGLEVPTLHSTTQGVADRKIYTVACTDKAASNATCRLYESTINGTGGFVPGSTHAIATLPPRAKIANAQPVFAGRHPVTGTIVLFVAAFRDSGETIDVYEQAGDGRPATLIARVPIAASTHYRVIDDGRRLLLHYLIRRGDLLGSYVVPVGAYHGRLMVGATRHLADAANGAEVAYLPAARRFAIYYRSSDVPSRIQRCFFDP